VLSVIDIKPGEHAVIYNGPIQDLSQDFYSLDGLGISSADRDQMKLAFRFASDKPVVHSKPIEILGYRQDVMP
jgi:hypothetical protein